MTVKKVPAGKFSSWLHRTGDLDVPCGSCTGCCRSSMFIHIKPEEKRALARIPKELLFPAPGLPKGHVLMGHNERGECPMLIKDKCSIYADRPQTCRDYDCRVYAATGTLPDTAAQPFVAERVRAWEFEAADEASKNELAAVRACATFLAKNEAGFPTEALPRNPAQRAILAIRMHRLFLEGAPVRQKTEVIALVLQDIAAVTPDE
jgi:uncharacterized protein